MRFAGEEELIKDCVTRPTVNGVNGWGDVFYLHLPPPGAIVMVLSW